MGTKMAVLPHAVATCIRIIDRDERNSMGKMRRSAVVKMAKVCWTPKMMNSTPEQTNRPMMRPLFHG